MQPELIDPVFKVHRPENRATDEERRKQIERQLGKSGYPQLRKIAVDVRDGIATLNGYVPSYYLKQVAQCAAMALGLVGRVTNDIEVSCRPATLGLAE